MSMLHMLKNSVRGVAAGCILAITFISNASADKQVNLHIMGAFPQNDFQDNVTAGIGYNLGYTKGYFCDKALSLRLGCDFGFIIYGYDHDIDVTTTNDIVQCGLVVQIAATTGEIQPYIDGKAGLSEFYTSKKIDNTLSSDDEESLGSTIFCDATGYTAIGVGFLIPLRSHIEPNMRKVTVSLDIRFNFFWSGNVEYLKKGSIKETIWGEEWDILDTRTDMTGLYLGLAFNF